VFGPLRALAEIALPEVRPDRIYQTQGSLRGSPAATIQKRQVAFAPALAANPTNHRGQQIFDTDSTHRCSLPPDTRARRESIFRSGEISHEKTRKESVRIPGPRVNVHSWKPVSDAALAVSQLPIPECFKYLNNSSPAPLGGGVHDLPTRVIPIRNCRLQNFQLGIARSRTPRIECRKTDLMSEAE